MSVNKKIAAPMQKIGAYAISVLCGLSVTAALTAAFSGGMYILGLPPEISGVLAFIAYAGGCLTAGLVCGCIKARGGLRTGLICALSILAVMLLVSLISGNLDGSAILAKTISAVIFTCTGAVIGVNKRYNSNTA